MKRYVALADFGFPGPKTFKLGGFPNEGYSRNASFSLNSISTFTLFDILYDWKVAENDHRYS